MEVALTHWFWYELEAQLPDGAQARVRLKVADLIASLALKGIAIGEWYAEKDAYAIYAFCAHSREGPQTVALALKPFMNEQPVQKGLRAIAQKFRPLVRIIHERFCCNRGFAAATRLSAGVLAAQSFNVLFQVRLSPSRLCLPVSRRNSAISRRTVIHNAG